MDILPLIWAGLIAFAVLAYVMLDGFDLGCGILFAVERDETDRDTIMRSIAPVWDGNETWLILGGGGLLAAFPPAYAVVMPALYPLIIAMLLALILRGVAFEFRSLAQSPGGRRFWTFAFFGGSLTAAFAQGVALGALVQGIHIEYKDGAWAYAGGWWDWLSGFSLLCGLALVTGYALLGATWLIWRTEGALQSRCRRYARPLAAVLLVLTGTVSFWTPLLDPRFFARWFGWPGMLLTSPVPLLLLVIAVLFWRSLARGGEKAPLLLSYAWFALCYAGLGISFYPSMIPPSLSIVQAAAPHESQMFLLVGAVILVPIVLAYTAQAYWVFRGKVKPGGYHE
jgi:cytochrome bd ubiquinol oxidase subunit II